jgi:hypothetical protein
MSFCGLSVISSTALRLQACLRIIMFTTEGNIEYICQPDVEIFGDGTFKYCRRYFSQLYTLLGYKPQISSIYRLL